MRTQRFDRGTLGKPTKMPNGFLKVDAFLTRTGVFEYQRADGSTRRELRTADEVFSEDSLGTLMLTSLTMGHPSRPVTSDNARGLGIGTVGQDVRRDGDRVRATMVITDGESIATMKRGTREVSCGYWCDLDETPGVTKGAAGVEDGLPYDAIQRGIIHNHVAIVDRGRAGPDIAARLDGATGTDVAVWDAAAVMVNDEERVDNPFGLRATSSGSFEVVNEQTGAVLSTHPTQEKAVTRLAELATDAAGDGGGLAAGGGTLKNALDHSGADKKDHGDPARNGDEPMKRKITLDGISYEFEADDTAFTAITKAVSGSEARADSLSSDLQASKAEAAVAVDEQKARADAAEEKAAKLTTELEKATDVDAIKSRVDARLQLERTGKDVLGDEFKSDATDADLKAAVIAKVHPKADLEGKSDAYVDARFDAAVEDAAAATDKKDAVNAAQGNVRKAAQKADGENESPLDASMRRAQERNDARWKKPLTESKDKSAA